MENGIQSFFIYILTALVGIVLWFLRGFHSETKGDIDGLKEGMRAMSEKQVQLDSNQKYLFDKQNEIEKSIEIEIKHIKEIMDTKLDYISKTLDKLVDKK